MQIISLDTICHLPRLKSIFPSKQFELLAESEVICKHMKVHNVVPVFWKLPSLQQLEYIKVA